MRSFIFSLAVVSVFGAAHAATPALPPNTVDCRDWTRNSNGTWTAHENAKRFDVADSKQIGFSGSTAPVGMMKTRNGVDIIGVVDRKCGPHK